MNTEHPGQLIEQARSGSEEAFSELVGLYQAKVRSYLGRFLVNSHAVEDLAQETFIAVFRSLPKYQEQGAFGLWVIGIARNLALKHLREERLGSSGRRTLREAVAHWSEERLTSGQAVPAEHDRRVSVLNGCLKRLQEQGALLVDEFYYQGRTTAEISRRTGRSEGAIWTALTRIRQALRECVRSRMAGTESV